ncbi:hypothetical protein BACIH_3529 [Bacillus amyloliquefaciens]|nr:hypothetical protein U471_35480 [Bacillus amyloliquefaciens CC178]QEY90057.1 hypothetical protein BACIT_2162 [Bacillus amyloliquefaciens]QEY95208.1 hypothetical protein BACIH_3529 [Bacillus amyloliquefaciens]
MRLTLAEGLFCPQNGLFEKTTHPPDATGCCFIRLDKSSYNGFFWRI